MDRTNSSKRPIDSDSSSSSSPPEIATREKRHCDAGRFLDLDLDLDLSFGVFDFPWLKESLINSKSEDWRFEDLFDGVYAGGESAFTIDTEFTEFSGRVWCDDLPDPWAVECDQAHAAGDGGGTAAAAEGMDCVWRSLLNQPLRQGSSAL